MASQLLVTVGENPERIFALARFCSPHSRQWHTLHTGPYGR
jgi:hypothetical protein